MADNYDFGSLDAGPGAFLGSDEDVSRINIENLIPSFYTQDFAGGLEAIDLNALTGDISSILNDPEVVKALQATDPEALNMLRSIQLPSDSGATGVKADTGLSEPNKGGTPLSGADLAIALGEGREVGETTGEGGFTASQEDQTQAVTDSSGKKAVGADIGLSDTTGIKSLIDQIKQAIKDVTGLDAGDAAKYASMLGIAKLAYDDAQRAREEARGWSAPGGYSKQAVRSPGGGVSFKKSGKAMGGGIGSLDMAQGGRALPPRYLDGHSDGMADKVPAHIDNKRPAALSDGEFVIPADVVSHLGNGNSNAGAKRLYKMMDDIRAARTGNPKQGKQINPDKFMPR